MRSRVGGAAVKPRVVVPALALAAAACLACAAAPSLVDADGESGFALYRSGRLSARELGELCRLGVREIVVLAGDAGERECRLLPEICPSLRVRYDRRQDARRPLDAAFLAGFDRWVEEARAEGRKIALRCTHGWHRAGRLTAYYRMRFDARTAEEAKAEMLRVGRFMRWHPQLGPQVDALADFVQGRPCGAPPEHCVRGGAAGGADARAAGFVDDACAAN